MNGARWETGEQRPERGLAPGAGTASRSESARSALQAQLGRLGRAWQQRPPGRGGTGAVDPVARVRIEDLARQMERLESRLNLILAAIVGTLVVDIVKAFVK